MKISRCLYLVALMLGLCGMAKADTLDFKMTVLDAPTFKPSFPVTSVDGSAFTVVFGKCQSFSPGLPPGVSSDGCFYFTNVSNTTLTNLDLTFANTAALNGQPAGCDTSVSGSAFADNTCSAPPTMVGGFYDLQFYGGVGVLPDTPGQQPMIYTIQEFGAKPKAFGTIDATLTAVPEPNSVLLLGTGVLMMGGAFFLNRRRGFIG